jgi:RNA polymerase sigma factor (TIGR02999 family)
VVFPAVFGQESLIPDNLYSVGNPSVMTMFGPITLAIPWRSSTMKDVTRILAAIEDGEPRASEELLPLVYDELRRLAAQKLAQEKPGQTLQPTALVHEAYLRLVDSETVSRWDSRGHFFAAAAEAMRRILVDLARRKRSERHGGGRRRCELWIGDQVTEPDYDGLLDLDEALVKLSRIHEQAAELVKLRVFARMTVEEVAQYQGVSPRTAKRTWAYARVWLMREMGLDSDPGCD